MTRRFLSRKDFIPSLEEVVCVAFQCKVLLWDCQRAQNNIACYDVTLQMIFLTNWAAPV